MACIDQGEFEHPEGSPHSPEVNVVAGSKMCHLQDAQQYHESTIRNTSSTLDEFGNATNDTYDFNGCCGKTPYRSGVGSKCKSKHMLDTLNPQPA